AKTGEILHIPRDDGEVVFKCRGRDQTIGNVDRSPLQLALPFKYAPSFRNRFAHRQDACVKPRAERVIEPLPQAGAAVLFGMNGESLAKLADTNHAGIKQVVVG